MAAQLDQIEKVCPHWVQCIVSRSADMVVLDVSTILASSFSVRGFETRGLTNPPPRAIKRFYALAFTFRRPIALVSIGKSLPAAEVSRL